MSKARFVSRGAAAVCLLAIAGCASSAPRVSLISSSPEPASAAAPAKKSRIRYAAVDGLAVYGTPSASGKVIARLAENEKVRRTEVQNGWARVISAESGVDGWVDDTKLSRRPEPSATDP